MAEEHPKPEQLVQIDYAPPKHSWLEPKVEFKRGNYNYGANPDHQK